MENLEEHRGGTLNAEAIMNVLFLIVIIWIIFAVWGKDIGGAFSAIAEGLVGRAKEITSGILGGLGGG